MHPVTPEEALTFNSSWKSPSVVVFQAKSANNQVDSEWKKYLDPAPLYQVSNVLGKTYRPLDPQMEPPGPNTIIAVDTEFVQVSVPEIEINSDGERNILRPITHALARTSIIRGSGHDEGVPFIDDYIIMKENVVDYLTSYSGITAEDLDQSIAAQRGHNLISLKHAYKKIWILLNLGCKFLGHGLKQDFRVINIHVPKSQVIDTSNLFFIKERFRKLSLQFLAHTLLQEDIQQVTHDSIEDARIALKLYRKYQEFEDAGILEQRLHEVYKVGASLGFKPPSKAGASNNNNSHGGYNGNGSNGSASRTRTPPTGGAAAGMGPVTPVRQGGGGPGGMGIYGSGGGSGFSGTVYGSGGSVLGMGMSSPASNAGWGAPGRGAGGGGSGGMQPPPGFR